MRYSEPLHPLLAIIVVMAASEGFDVFKRRKGQPSLQSYGPPMTRQSVRSKSHTGTV
jgi:hypothetical protein